MSKVRKSPTILKPTIDEKTALQFASVGSPPQSLFTTDKVSAPSPKQSSAKKPSTSEVGKNVRQILLKLKKDLYERIAKDAARKDRTPEEHLIRHLTKRYDK
jgi:hypothetical protein